MDLHAHDIDIFMDVDSMGPGQFDTIILNQIAARPYFLPILMPSALERCIDPTDWVRREIEHALKLNRLIILLYTSDFKFNDLNRFLPEKDAVELARFNGVELHQRYFDAAMAQVRHFLTPVNLPITPTPKTEQIVVQQIRAQITGFSVNIMQMSAEDYYERGGNRYEQDDFEGAIAEYTGAIELNPHYTYAYCGRGLARIGKGDLEGAIGDASEAIRLNPNYADAYLCRGHARQLRGEFSGANEDYTTAIQLNPQLAAAYYGRGLARTKRGDKRGAAADFRRALQIRPNYSEAQHELSKL